jgi:hypothetical protein
MHSVFVYGSLMADDVVRLLLNRIPQTASATLPDLYDSISAKSIFFVEIEKN